MKKLQSSLDMVITVQEISRQYDVAIMLEKQRRRYYIENNVDPEIYIVDYESILVPEINRKQLCKQIDVIK